MSAATETTRSKHAFGLSVRPIPVGDNPWEVARIQCDTPLSRSHNSFIIPCLSPYGHAVVEVVERIKRADHLLAAFSLDTAGRVSFVAQLLHGPGAGDKVKFRPLPTRVAAAVDLEFLGNARTCIQLVSRAEWMPPRTPLAFLGLTERAELGRLLGDLRHVDMNQ